MENNKKITKDDYKKYFGLNNSENAELHKKAFEKAWEIRNFEIDKFWQRSAYFWGFIAIIFGGYIAVVTKESNILSKNTYLDLYLILLGLIFSVAWLLVICGSKRWQDNWEAHIDYLEDAITGPLYKTVYYTGKKYFSVSKINFILAWVVIITWVFLLLHYFYTNYINSKDVDVLELIFKHPNKIIFLILPLLGTVICIVVMYKKGQTSGGEYRVDLNKDEHGAFLRRD